MIKLRNVLKKGLLLSLISTVLFSISLFAQQAATTADGGKVWLYSNGTWKFQEEEQQKIQKNSIEIPAVSNNDSLIRHQAYTLLFDKKYQQSKWVAYELTAEETIKKVNRVNDFLPDPLIASYTNHAKDYAFSGYDRGHLAPAADMTWDENVMKESFYYSNMSPQVPAFNRGIWKRLEDQVRDWATENQALLIVSGPVLNSSLPTLGFHHIAIPKKYYKVVVDYRLPDIKGIAFLMNNEASSLPLQSFAVSIDSVQKVTGINFFPSFNEQEENTIEKNICLPCWSWGSKVPIQKTVNQTLQTEKLSTPTQSKSVQCSAITKSGKRCTRMTTNTNGLCYQHQ